MAKSRDAGKRKLSKKGFLVDMHRTERKQAYSKDASLFPDGRSTAGKVKIVLSSSHGGSQSKRSLEAKRLCMHSMQSI